jgi:large subunit ribosomal protein L30
MATITVKLAKSRFGANPKQRGTLAALGLKKIRQERSFEKTATVVGMIEKVKHLVEVTES